ncbi:MAG: DUF4838 domain-containing protein, partial [Verrucomicrobiae bacterium]|nr:DUF4838 domain-containing protein [Verrucomicrobiae bacterium]
MKAIVSGFVLLAVLVATPDVSRSAESVILAEQKTARVPIVIKADAGETTRAVANELAGFLERISGAKFSISDSGSPPEHGIFVGTVKEFPLPEFADALAIHDTYDGVESFVIVPRDGSLYLVGATETGTSHAVFRFLEKLGCRWFFPAPEWEVLPSFDRLEVDFEVTDRPAIQTRRIWWGYGYFDHKEGRCRAETEAWRRRNLMADSFRLSNGHAWQSIILENKETFEAHPEYLALVDGKRRKPQLCVSNPAVRKLAIAWALQRLERRPELDMVSMETSDGLNHCECENCLALGSVSDRAFGLANEVARAVTEKLPGKMVGMLAYSDHSEPPTFALESNVYVQLTAGFTHGEYTFDELKELWPKKTRNFGIYEYFSVWLWDFDQLPGGKANNLAMVTERFRDYAARGATSITCESSNAWGPNGRGYYVANRLMWDPDVDIEALLGDFYDKAFGPSAAPMRRYYDRLDRSDHPLMSEHLIGLAFRDLDEATTLAADRADVLARLDQLKRYLHYVRLRWELDHLPKNDPERKSLTLDALTWGYRNRYDYMNHWEAFRQTWSKEAAEEFDEPTWSFRHTESPPPWQVDSPANAGETERLFRQDLERFQPQDVAEIDFSEDLVPAGLTGHEEPKPLTHRFQRPVRYAFYSPDGSPLKLSIETGVIAAFRDKADGEWTVTDPDGEEIASGRLPQ